MGICRKPCRKSSFENTRARAHSNPLDSSPWSLLLSVSALFGSHGRLWRNAVLLFSFDATDPKDDDSTTRFVVNNLVGPPPEELLPVVPDEVMETVREESIGMRLRPSQASMRLEAAMAAKEVEAWG